MGKNIVALVLLCLIVNAGQLGEDKGLIGVKEQGCDLECMKNCGTGSETLCSEECCGKLRSEKGVAKDGTKEKIKWWVNTQASKTFNFSMCRKDCDRFCLSIKGNVEICKNKCAEKFCDEGSSTPGFVFIGSVIIFCIFVIVRKYLMKNIQVTDGYRYRRV